jgi:hypothetical protein
MGSGTKWEGAKGTERRRIVFATSWRLMAAPGALWSPVGVCFCVFPSASAANFGSHGKIALRGGYAFFFYPPCYYSKSDQEAYPLIGYGGHHNTLNGELFLHPAIYIYIYIYIYDRFPTPLKSVPYYTTPHRLSHHSTPSLHHSTPSLHHPTPSLHHPTPSLHHSYRLKSIKHNFRPRRDEDEA